MYVFVMWHACIWSGDMHVNITIHTKKHNYTMHVIGNMCVGILSYACYMHNISNKVMGVTVFKKIVLRNEK